MTEPSSPPAEGTEQHSSASAPASVEAAIPLSVTEVTRTFGRHKALAGVSLSLSGGEVTGLLGPNGAGKTTLIRIIAGRLAPSSGQVRVCGSDPYREQAARGRIGLVPQHLALYDSLTARENLEVFGQIFGLTVAEARQRAQTLLDQTGLAGRAAARVSALSGGMRRRLNIAAAVMHRPALLLLDEPSVGVDIEAMEGVIALIRALKQEGYAIVLSTHDMALAEAVCGRVCIVRAGAVIADDTPAALKRTAFSGRQIVSVAFADLVTEAEQRARIAALGLDETPGGWSGQVADSTALMTSLAQLPGAPSISRMSLREPDLADVYRAMTAEPAPAAEELQKRQAS